MVVDVLSEDLCDEVVHSTRPESPTTRDSRWLWKILTTNGTFVVGQDLGFVERFWCLKVGTENGEHRVSGKSCREELVRRW